MPAGPAFLATHLLGCSILWASGFLFIKLAPEIPPLALAAVRGAVAAAFLSAWFLLRGESLFPGRREWRSWAVLGTLNGWGPNILVAFALTGIGAGLAAMIQASGPLIVALLSHWLFADERLDARRCLGIATGFVGVGVLIGPGALSASAASLPGTLAMLAVAVLYALGNVYVRTVPGAEPARLALGQQLVSGIAASGLALAVGGPAAFGAVPDHGPVLLALGILATAMPIVLFMRLIRRAGPTRAATVGYLMPVWAMLLAILFLGETVSAREIAGGFVVLAGVALVSWPRLTPRAGPKPPASPAASPPAAASPAPRRHG